VVITSSTATISNGAAHFATIARSARVRKTTVKSDMDPAQGWRSGSCDVTCTTTISKPSRGFTSRSVWRALFRWLQLLARVKQIAPRALPNPIDGGPGESREEIMQVMDDCAPPMSIHHRYLRPAANMPPSAFLEPDEFKALEQIAHAKLPDGLREPAHALLWLPAKASRSERAWRSR
jgi:hypothetical protein